MTHQYDHRAYFFKIDVTIKKIRSALQKRFTESDLDLTVDQWVILENVYREKSIGQNKLGEITFKDAPTVTRIIDILQRKGLVNRGTCDDDRRKYLITLTEEGLKLYNQAQVVVGEIRNVGWNGLSDSDYDKLVYLMDKIYDNCNEI